MSAHVFYRFLKHSHLLLISQHTYHIIPCNNSKFRKQGFQHLEVSVVYPIKQYGIYIFKYYMLFYQRLYPLNNFVQNYKKLSILHYFCLSLCIKTIFFG